MKILGWNITKDSDDKTKFKDELRAYLSDGGFVDNEITKNGALSISAVWSCVRLISQSIATLPIHVFQKTDSGRTQLSDHYLSKLLKRPNGINLKSAFFETLLTHLLLWGNGYAIIVRDNYFRPQKLILCHPSQITARVIDGELFYDVAGTSTPLATYDVIHLRGLSTDGIVGKSPIAVHRENLGLAKSALAYGRRFFDAGGNTSSVYETGATLSDEGFERLKKQINERQHGVENSHKPLILEGGMKYSRINIPLEDAQFIATRKFQKSEVATIYGVPPHLIADLDRATNNNIEQQSIEFVGYCLRPYIVQLEEELGAKLLLESDQDIYLSFNINALMRGDQAARSAFYRNMFYIGAMAPNEIRALEDMNGFTGGDEFFVQTNMANIKNLKSQNNGQN